MKEREQKAKQQAEGHARSVRTEPNTKPAKVEPLGFLRLAAQGKPISRLAEPVTVVLTQRALTQLHGYVYRTNIEITCLGTVDRRGSRFVIEELFLLEQVGCSAHTELDPEAFGVFVERLLKDGKRDQASRLKCWLHSHPCMETFWSRTDEATCRHLVSDFLVSIVAGQDGDLRCRIDTKTPIGLTVDHVPVLCEWATDEGLLDACAKEVEEKVKLEVLAPPPRHGPRRDDSLWDWPEDGDGRFGREADLHGQESDETRLTEDAYEYPVSIHDVAEWDEEWDQELLEFGGEVPAGRRRNRDRRR